MKRSRWICGAMLAAGVLTACATAPWDEDPRSPRAETARHEYDGTVVSVREMEIPSRRTGVAPMVGAVVGGTVGSRAGQGRGSSAGAVLGSVLGGVAGEAAAHAATEPGLEITVKLDNGRVIAVAQPAGGEFQSGDRVRVISDGSLARVTRQP